MFARNFLRGSPWLPATITNRCGPLSFKVKVLEGDMVWRRHLRQCFVIDSQATRAIAPSVNITHYDLMGPDDFIDSVSNETEENRLVKHPPCRNPKRKCAQPKRYVV